MIKPRYILEQMKGYFDSPEAVVLTGMRRTGKTTLLNFLYEQTESKNKILIDMKNPLNRKYFEEDNFEKIKASLEFLGLDFKSRPYIFIDEIQFVKALPSVAKYFIDNYKVKFFMTGSASYYLKNLFSESLAGRKVIFEIFPLTFQEFLTFKDVPLKIPDNMSDITRPVFDTIMPLYEEYIFYGGFPEVVLKSNTGEKKKALEDIFTSFFQLEVVQLGDFRRNVIIRDLMLLLMQNTGSKLDIQKILRDLGVSRASVYEYIAFLESTYFIKTIKPYSKGRSTKVRKMPKVYVCDAGLANRFARLDGGCIFENSVFQNLRIKGEINYYKRKTGVEIDFILDKGVAFEVKINAQLSSLRKLHELAKKLDLESYKIVTKRCSELDDVIYRFLI